MALRDQHVVLKTVPASRPIFVCPTDTERKIGLTRFKHPANGQIKKDFAAEPIVIKAETIDPVYLCQFSLFLQDLCFTQIVVTESCGYMRLVMTGKVRPSSANVIPFGKPFAPPAIILGNRV